MCDQKFYGNKFLNELVLEFETLNYNDMNNTNPDYFLIYSINPRNDYHLKI